MTGQNESQTPRTDERILTLISEPEDQCIKLELEIFASTLEKELTAANANLAQARIAIDDLTQRLDASNAIRDDWERAAVEQSKKRVAAERARDSYKEQLTDALTLIDTLAHPVKPLDFSKPLFEQVQSILKCAEARKTHENTQDDGAELRSSDWLGALGAALRRDVERREKAWIEQDLNGWHDAVCDIRALSQLLERERGRALHARPANAAGKDR